MIHTIKNKNTYTCIYKEILKFQKSVHVHPRSLSFFDVFISSQKKLGLNEPISYLDDER